MLAVYGRLICNAGVCLPFSSQLCGGAGRGELLRGGNWAYFDLGFFGSGKGATAIDCSPNSGMQASAVTFWLMAG
jgi:hypothetical protein